MKSVPFSLPQRHKRRRPANSKGISITGSGSGLGKDTAVRSAALLVVYVAALAAGAAFTFDLRYSPDAEVTCSAGAALGAAGAVLGGRR